MLGPASGDYRPLRMPTGHLTTTSKAWGSVAAPSIEPMRFHDLQRFVKQDHGFAIECRRRTVLLCLWALHHDTMHCSPPVLIPRYTGLHDYFAQRFSLVSGFSIRSKAHVVAPSPKPGLNGLLSNHVPPSSKTTMDYALRSSFFPRSTDACFSPSSPKALTTTESIASTATVSPHANKTNLANQKPTSYISWPGMLYRGTPSWLIVLYAMRL